MEKAESRKLKAKSQTISGSWKQNLKAKLGQKKLKAESKSFILETESEKPKAKVLSFSFQTLFPILSRILFFWEMNGNKIKIFLLWTSESFVMSLFIIHSLLK
jgi:hypothetical protein